MFVTIVDVWVKQERVNEFIEASEKNHLASVQEPENLRFDILQSQDDPCKFVLYEAYQTEAGAKAHKDTAHYLQWRETVADMMAQPRQGHVHNGLKP